MATNGADQQNQAGRHQEVGHKSLLQSDALYQVTKHVHTIKAMNIQNLQQEKKKILENWMVIKLKAHVFLFGFSILFCVVYIGDKCVPKRAWIHEGAQRSDCKAPMVCSDFTNQIKIHQFWK